MARRKADKAGEGERPITADFSAKLLETYAGMILELAGRSAAEGTTGPGWLSLSQTLDLTLTPDDRAILLGLPGLAEPLRRRLDVDADGPLTIQITLEELTGLFLALSYGISEAQGRDALMVMQVAANVASCFNDLLSRRIPATHRKGRAKRTQPSQARRRIYQLKITLLGIEPPIWRRVQVEDCSLVKLHGVVQVAMGWKDEHLYDFEIKGQRYCDPGRLNDLDMADAGQTKLSRVITRKGAKIRYRYDFGDEWRHEIVVEQITTPEEGREHPICLDGGRACPPEDIGGVGGYYDYVEAIRDPSHRRHEDYRGWVGEFDPEAFDLDAMNEGLRRLR
jgi:hypothetical protein